MIDGGGNGGECTVSFSTIFEGNNWDIYSKMDRYVNGVCSTHFEGGSRVDLVVFGVAVFVEGLEGWRRQFVLVVEAHDLSQEHSSLEEYLLRYISASSHRL